MNRHRAFLFVVLLAAMFVAGCVEQPVACTAGAKICPDGTAVGREGPTCEFAACPEGREDVKFQSKDVQVCATIRFACEDSYVPFSNELGCGCAREDIACTQEAKLCDDGSGVGRVWPTCEFSACPEESEDPRKYVSDDPEMCATLRFQCTEGGEPFFDDTGCGCETPQAPAEPEQTLCDPAQRHVDACIEIYQPVCGWFDPGKIQCIRYPCAQTYSNSCFACDNPDVIAWSEGECPA